MNRTSHILSTLLVVILQPLAAAAQLDSSNTWVSTALPSGPHTVNSVILDPTQRDTVFAGTTPGSIFRSLNTTSTWLEITNAGTTINQDVYGISFNPLNANVLFAGSLNTGAYKSVDRGVTWTATSLVGPYTTWDLVFDLADTTRMYAATGITLFISDDAGVTWSDARIDTVSGVNARAFVVMPLSPDTLLVGVPTDGVYRSVDRGVTWTIPNVGLTDLDLTEIVASPEFASTAYAATTGGGIFVSTDGGISWTAQNTGITNLNIESITISPSNPTVMYAGSDNGEIFKSPDRGTTWLDITGDLAAAVAVNDLFVHPDSANVVYAALDEVYRIKQAGLDSVSFFPTGAAPIVLAVADVDADSIADIIVANAGAQSVQVMLNGSQGATFSTVAYATGAEPAVFGSGDLEGDGDIDVIVGNRLQQTIAILFNDSTGTFASPIEIFVGRSVTEMVVADLDTDQDIDIAVTDDVVGTIAIYLNDGLGSYGAPKLITGPTTPTSMVGGDFNGDGITDLLVASSDGSVTLLRNLGNASFQVDPALSIGGAPAHLQAGDFDIDGDLDFAAATNDQMVRIWSNFGTGSFGDSMEVAIADTANSLTAVDLDEDGYLDLLTPLGNGDITVLINDANGVFTDSVVVGNQVGLGAGVTGDLDGDTTADLILARPTDNGLLFYANPLPQNIKTPAPPRDLVAADTQSDLGGRITLTWRRPNVDETTGRVETYEVMRATDSAGPYVLLTSLDTSTTNVRDSVFVNRTYIDTSATVGTTHSYYVLSENGSGVQSISSDTVSATSVPQPFFDFSFSQNSPLHIGDTIEVTARVTSISHKPAGLSLFVDYDTRALTLLDADASTPTIQPFEVDSTLSTQASILQNRVDTTTTSGTGQIDLTFGFLPDLGSEAAELGTLRFVTQRDTTTRIRVVNDTTTVRQSALTDSVGSLILPFIPPATTLVIRNHKVRGSLGFQGRTENLDVDARFDLTTHDSSGTGTVLPDSVAYQPPNDLDLNRSGVQLRLATNGSFVLEQVPGGTYGLFVKTFHYLRTRISTDSLVVNDSTGVSGNVSFSWVGIDASFTSTALRAGDANDDNQVDLADFGLLGSNFGSSGFAVNSPGWSADFNGDGVVNLADFGLLQSNFGEVGLGPSVATKPVVPKGEVFVATAQGDGNGRVVAVQNAGPIRGFSVDVVLPTEVTSQNGKGIDGLAFFDAGEALQLSRQLDVGGQTITRVAAIFKDGTSFPGDGSLFSILLGDVSPEVIRLERVRFLDVSGAVVPGIGSPINVIDAVPKLRTALLQNIPNPFNPATLIPYQLGSAGRVKITVYSTLGQKIRVLVDGQQEIGRYEARWDGRDHGGREVASGVYLYRFEVGRYVDVRKAVLLR